MTTGWIIRLSLLFLLCLPMAVTAARETNQTAIAHVGRQLAAELATENEHDAAAIEYRRLALNESGEDRQGGYYWAAAYEYFQYGNCPLVENMLDRAEDRAPDLEWPIQLLRGEASFRDRPEQAAFYFDNVLSGAPNEDARQLAAQRLAHIRLSFGDCSAAQEAIRRAPRESDELVRAIVSYEDGQDKRPWVGGLLGLVPGLGYAYSGEYANALRALLLNSLFIYGLVDTAEDEEWGAFSVIAFFELTWYTGSIYGGIDAAHRYNRRRLDAALDSVDSDAGFGLHHATVPVIKLHYRF